MIPAIRRKQDVVGYGSAKAIAIVFRVRDCWLVLATVLDPRLELLVPRVRSDGVDDADDDLTARLIKARHQAIVHHVLLGQKQGVVPHAGLK